MSMGVPSPLITRSDKVMSGVVVFAGTRVPVQTLLDYLEEGDTLDQFLEDFPTVSRDRKSTRLNSSHLVISYAVFCLKKKKRTKNDCQLLLKCYESSSLVDV